MPVILVTLWLKTRIDASTKTNVIRVEAPKAPFSTEEAAAPREITEKVSLELLASCETFRVCSRSHVAGVRFGAVAGVAEEHGCAVADSERHPLQVGRHGAAVVADYSVAHQGAHAFSHLRTFYNDFSHTQLWTSELFQSYVLGTPIVRPFPVAKSPFADLLAGFTGGGADEAAAEKKAKKSAKAKSITSPATKV